MRILLCSPTFRTITHGPAKFANLVLKVNELYPEHEIRILTEDIEESSEKVHRIDIRYPRPVHALGKFLRMWSYHNAAKRIRQEYPFDVLIYNDAILGLLSAVLMPEEVNVAGMLNDYKYLHAGWRHMRWTKLWLINTIHRPFERLFCRLGDLTITNSEYLKTEVIQQYRIPGNKVKRLYKSVEVDEISFKPPLDIDEISIRILFVKNDYLTGGLHILAEALSILTDYRFVATVVGPALSKERHIRFLFNRVSNVALDFRGPQTQSQVFEAMHTHHILCIPSLKEPLGVANIEGLASGISVVTSSAGGIPEALDYGRNGWMAVPGDARDLAEKLKECILHPKERIEKAVAGRKFVERHFDYRDMLRNFLQILAEP
jgi:colanic acid/amylovoran biosynthesis glycosyltransferase